MGADPHRPVSARVRSVRGLPGHVRPMARTQSRDLPAPVRGPGVLPHRGQYDFVFVDCGKSEVSAGPVSVGLLHPREEVDPLALRDLHHSLGGAGHPDHLLHPLHAQPGMGACELAHLPAHGAGRAQLAYQSATRDGDGDAGAHLEGAALLDPDPDGRAARDPEGALRGGERRRSERLAEVQVRDMAVDPDSVFDFDFAEHDLDADPDLPHLPVLDLVEGFGVLRRAVARQADAAQLRHGVPAGELLPAPLLEPDLELAVDRARRGRDHARGGDLRRLRHQPPQGTRRAHRDERSALHLFHPGGVPGSADVQGDGRLRPAEQPLVARARDGHARLALRDLGAEAGLRQAAVGARRGGAHRRRHAAAAFPPRLPAADAALASRDRHLRRAARLERVPVRVPAAVAREHHPACGRPGPLPRLGRLALGDPHGDRAHLRAAAGRDLLCFSKVYGRRTDQRSSEELMALVSFSQIEKSFGATKVVHGISLDIADGEFMVLVGPSGCGKSTLLRMLAGLEEIGGGTIAIDGRVVNDVDSKDRNVAMVFQSYALYPHMTVRENMGFSLRLRKESNRVIEERVSQAARILNLEPYLDRYPRELSGGQRQRVAMGRAIVRDPKVFLFDEPLSNLDAKLRVAMRAEIKALHQRLKTTTVYVTHDQVEAMTMADRIAVMHDGRIEQIGTPLVLYDHPDNLFVAQFIGSPAMNVVEGTLKRAGGAAHVEAGGVRWPLFQGPGAD